MTVADRIREKRIEMGYTQAELAKLIGNKDKSSISKIENNGNDVTLKDVSRIAEVLNVSQSYLMGWEDETNRYSNINTAAVASLMLEPSNKELIEIINEMNSSQKEELLHYAKFLKKRED